MELAIAYWTSRRVYDLRNAQYEGKTRTAMVSDGDIPLCEREVNLSGERRGLR